MCFNQRIGLVWGRLAARLMNNELKNIWKDTTAACFEVHYRYVPGGTEKNTKNLSQDSRRPSSNSNTSLSE
jgi:hypothetical protein